MFETGRFIPGGPALYSSPNRTAAWIDKELFQTCLIFCVIYLGFLFTLPIVRRKRLVTLFLVTLLTFKGLMIFIGLQYPAWQVGSVEVPSSLGGPGTTARITLSIGLDHANISMVDVQGGQFHFNEVVRYSEYKDREFMRAALSRGCPTEVLTVMEYLAPLSEYYSLVSLGYNGLEFLPSYISSGFIARALLLYSVALWIFTFIFFLAIPVYAHFLLGFTGLTVLGSVLAFTATGPTREVVLHINGEFLQVRYGWVYYALLVCGGLAVMGFFALFVYQDLLKQRLITVIELDFDTPFYWSDFVRREETERQYKKKMDRDYQFHNNEMLVLQPYREGGDTGSSVTSHPRFSTLPESLV